MSAYKGLSAERCDRVSQILNCRNAALSSPFKNSSSKDPFRPLKRTGVRVIDPIRKKHPVIFAKLAPGADEGDMGVEEHRKWPDGSLSLTTALVCVCNGNKSTPCVMRRGERSIRSHSSFLPSPGSLR